MTRQDLIDIAKKSGACAIWIHKTGTTSDITKGRELCQVVFEFKEEPDYIFQKTLANRLPMLFETRGGREAEYLLGGCYPIKYYYILTGDKCPLDNETYIRVEVAE